MINMFLRGGKNVENGPVDKLRLPKSIPTENKPMCAAENQKGSKSWK